MENLTFYRTRRALGKFSFALSLLESDKNLAELKNYFTSYILVVFYNEFEDKLKESLKEALQSHSTKDLSQFISKAMETIFKRIDRKDLSKTIGYFGEERPVIFLWFFITSLKINSKNPLKRL